MASKSKYGKYTIYTADDESPKCVNCDYFCGGFDCEAACGARHGWWGYQRMQFNDNDDDKIN